MTEPSAITPYSPVLVRLLQGVVYEEDKDVWDLLLTHQAGVKHYFQVIGLDIEIHPSEGFAFLKQQEFLEGDQKIPELIIKRSLTYPVTLLCVLLVEKLIEFEAAGSDNSRLMIEGEEIKDMVRLFLPEKSNEAKSMDQMESAINKLVEYGFLRPLQGNDKLYEVKRILKARLPAEKLAEVKQKLEAYAKSA